jgi:hypothetical protein
MFALKTGSSILSEANEGAIAAPGSVAGAEWPAVPFEL